MIKKVFSALGIMLIATACQPQADDNNGPTNGPERTEQMRDADKAPRASRGSRMDQSGRSDSRARMNQRAPRAARPAPSDDCGCDDCCGSCGPCCD